MRNSKFTEPVGKAVRSVNSMQLHRIEAVVDMHTYNERATLYLNGRLTTSKSIEFAPYMLDRMSSRTARIVISQVSRTVDSTVGIQDRFSSTFVDVAHAHNVCDLFVHACKCFPEFAQASSVAFQDVTPVIVSKPMTSPVPYDGTEPPLAFKPSKFLNQTRIKPSAFKNGIAFGGTGSGKTVSFILPVLSSLIDYRLSEGRTTSILVIDPKAELLASVKHQLGSLNEDDRLVMLGQCAPFSLFNNEDTLTLTDRFERVKAFTGSASTENAPDARWQIMAEQLILGILRDDQIFANTTGLPLLECLCVLITGEHAWMQTSQWACLKRLLTMGMESPSKLRHISDFYDVLTQCVGMKDAERPLSRYVAIKDAVDQYFYNARGALTIVESLADPDLNLVMDASVRRGLATAKRTDIGALISCGKVIVFQPKANHTFDVLGRALKSLFFSAVMEREDMTRPVGYVCDEFQRFITQDSETGDQNFLDRCRAYRVNSVLATQSMAALLSAMGSSPGGGSALDSILVNTPTKCCFRTPDLQTAAAMSAFIPPSPFHKEHVLKCRPPSSLKTGECYFTMEDTWGRTRYQLSEQQLGFDTSEGCIRNSARHQ